MWDEVNTGCNLPAQIDLYATDSDKYEFLFIAKGGGSANKTYLYQETKAIITPEKLIPFMVEKMKGLGTAACPPYHIAWVVGGTSAEACLKTVKLASSSISTLSRPKATSSDTPSATWSLKRNSWRKPANWESERNSGARISRSTCA